MFTETRYSSRKYIDLIFQASSKWANWDPPCEVRCGDFGTINRETGQFEIEGNVYNESFIESLHPYHAKTLRLHQPVDGGVEENYVVTTTGVSAVDLGVSSQTGIAGVANAGVALRLRFPDGKRAASLVMHKPRMTYIPPGLPIERLFDVDELNRKCLVIKTFSCPAYSLYLSNKSGEEVSLALEANSPLPVAPTTAGGQVYASWKTNIEASCHRSGSSQQGEYKFTPLFELRYRRHGFFGRSPWRDTPPPRPSADGYGFWTEAEVPWDTLDDDGQQVFEVWDDDEEGDEFNFDAYDEELEQGPTA